MPVILVIIIAVAWIGILAPNVVKRRARLGDGISSISHFHHQLRVLEHSAPEPIVAPAYRLRTVDGDGTVGPVSGAGEDGATPVLTVVGADQLPRPALAFLGRDQDEAPAEAMPTQVVSIPQVSAANRQLVRRRRRDTLGVLCAVFVTTLLLGFLPGADVAWVVCGLCALALAGYVGLLVRFRKLAEERAQKLHYLREVRPVPAAGPAPEWQPASTGRFAHPAYQMSAAH